MQFTRKPNRLPFSEIYKTNNSFFVTICVVERKCIFVEEKPLTLANKVEENFNSPEGDIVQNNGQINLSPTGKIVERTWINLLNLFENIVLDEFVIMPNHFHGIITFLDTPISKFTGKITDLSKIIKYFKSKTTIKIKQFVVEEKLAFPGNVEEKLVSPISQDPNEYNNHGENIHGELKFASTKELIQNHNTIWQKSFYDHVIRDEKDFQRIQEYIYNNPLKWELDILNPKNNQNYQKWLIAKTNKTLFNHKVNS